MSHRQKKWSAEDTGQLIEVYKQYPLLWDPKDSNYGNKIKRLACLKEISVVFETTVPELHRKLRLMNNLYYKDRREYKKFRKSGRSDYFHAKWFGYSAMRFLRKIKPQPELVNNSSDSSEEEQCGNEESDDRQENPIQCVQKFEATDTYIGDLPLEDVESSKAWPFVGVAGTSSSYQPMHSQVSSSSGQYYEEEKQDGNPIESIHSLAINTHTSAKGKCLPKNCRRRTVKRASAQEKVDQLVSDESIVTISLISDEESDTVDQDEESDISKKGEKSEHCLDDKEHREDVGLYESILFPKHLQQLQKLEEPDEFDVFGTYVARKIRSLPDDYSRHYIQAAIISILENPQSATMFPVAGNSNILAASFFETQ